MFGINSLENSVLSKLSTGFAHAVLPKKFSTFVDNLVAMGNDGEELRDKLLDPVNGPLIPYCTKQYSFDTNRLMFCSSVTRDVIMISADGIGIETLAETLISSPDQVFSFLTEAIIPTLDSMADDGKPSFKNNMDAALQFLVGLSTDDLSNMTLDQFLAVIANNNKKQTGGSSSKDTLCTLKELKILAKYFGLPTYGTKSQLLNRIDSIHLDN